MVRYLSLITLTQRGIENLSDSVNRAEQFEHSVEAAGGRMVGQFWSVGEFDGCFIFEAPDEAVASTLLLDLSSQGNVRTKTTRLLNREEFQDLMPD